MVVVTYSYLELVLRRTYGVRAFFGPFARHAGLKRKGPALAKAVIPSVMTWAKRRQRRNPKTTFSTNQIHKRLVSACYKESRRMLERDQSGRD